MEIGSFARIRLEGNSHTRSLPFYRVGRRPGRCLTFHCGFSRFLPRDRRLCSLQLIAVRPNGSSIRVNTVAIMSRPRSLLPKREARRNVCPRRTLCAYICSLSSYELISHNRSRLARPFPLLSPS